jgi:hypothetical protein
MGQAQLALLSRCFKLGRIVITDPNFRTLLYHDLPDHVNTAVVPIAMQDRLRTSEHQSADDRPAYRLALNAHVCTRAEPGIPQSTPRTALEKMPLSTKVRVTMGELPGAAPGLTSQLHALSEAIPTSFARAGDRIVRTRTRRVFCMTGFISNPNLFL